MADEEEMMLPWKIAGLIENNGVEILRSRLPGFKCAWGQRRL